MYAPEEIGCGSVFEDGPTGRSEGCRHPRCMKGIKKVRRAGSERIVRRGGDVIPRYTDLTAMRCPCLFVGIQQPTIHHSRCKLVEVVINMSRVPMILSVRRVWL